MGATFQAAISIPSGCSATAVPAPPRLVGTLNLPMTTFTATPSSRSGLFEAHRDRRPQLPHHVRGLDESVLHRGGKVLQADNCFRRVRALHDEVVPPLPPKAHPIEWR